MKVKFIIKPVSYTHLYIGEFFTGLNQDVEIEIFEEDGGYRIMLNAENNAVIIGKNGQTLQALNTVVRGAVNSAFRKRFSVMIDINHYKEERYEKVKSIAGRIAKTVQDVYKRQNIKLSIVYPYQNSLL